MAITLDGTTGISSVDGSAASPSVRGADSNSGIVYAADTVSISTGGSERLEVDSSGNVDIPDNGKIRLGGSGDLSLWHDGSNTKIDNATGELQIFADTFRVISKTNDANVIRGVNAGAVKLYWDNNLKFETEAGGGKITGSLTQTSDIALKEDIKSLSNSLSNLKQLNGYSYKFKETGIKSVGLTAQEVEKVYPDLVSGEEGQKGLNYSGLIAPLIESVKELSAEVETLKTKVAALEAG